MHAWVLSLIICSATPLPDGSFCEVRAVDYGMSREQCRSALTRETARITPAMRLECTEDPALSAALEETDEPGEAAPSPSAPATLRRPR